MFSLKRNTKNLNHLYTLNIKCIQNTHKTAETKVEHLKSYNDIPGPKSYPLVGNLFSLKQFGMSYTLRI